MFYVPAISEDRFVEYFEIQIAQSDTTVITGLVGSQIKDSVFIAKTLLKNNKQKFGLNEIKDFHIHFTNNDIFKDGPSASLGIFMAILYYQKYHTKMKLINSDFTFLVTGDVDLRGNVKEIGGLKEKRKFFRKENFSLFVIPKEGNEVLRYSDELSRDNIYDTLSIIEKRASHVEKI